MKIVACLFGILLSTVANATVAPNSVINISPQPTNALAHMHAVEMLGTAFTITAFICNDRNVAVNIIESGKTPKEFIRKLTVHRCAPRLDWYQLIDTMSYRQVTVSGVQETWFALVLRDGEGKTLHGIMGVRD